MKVIKPQRLVLKIGGAIMSFSERYSWFLTTLIVSIDQAANVDKLPWIKLSLVSFKLIIKEGSKCFSLIAIFCCSKFYFCRFTHKRILLIMCLSIFFNNAIFNLFFTVLTSTKRSMAICSMISLKKLSI